MERKKLNKTLLIVDDDTEIVQSMVHFLGRNFDRCFTAYNGVEALEILKKESVDVVLTDMVMPKMDGYNLILNILEKHPEIKHINIITGHAEEESLQGMEELNIPIFMKPVNIRDVRDRLLEEVKDES